MKKTYLKSSLFLLLMLAMFSCSQSESATTENETTTEVVEETEVNEEASESTMDLGNFENLVGKWTVSAEVAGAQMDVEFKKDGTFNSKLGAAEPNNGTWEVVDDEHIMVVTKHTDGQLNRITDITDESMNLCWNPKSDNPKTIPMTRVK